MAIIISILGILITILLVVGIHELGHFLMARALNIKVQRFSIGFGKRLFHWYDKKGTEYVLAAIPLGGYVKLLDEHEGDVSETEKHLAYNRQPLYKRIAVIVAGPISNLVFAFLVYWLLFMVGFNSIVPVIGSVLPHSIAADAGIKPDQEILRIDQKKTPNWMSVMIHLLSRAGETTPMQIETKPLATDKTETYTLDLTTWHIDELKPDPLLGLGVKPYDPIIPAVIGEVAPESPAARAGLMAGDSITAVQGKPIHDWFELSETIAKNPGKTLAFTVKHATQITTRSITVGTHDALFSPATGFLGISVQFKLPPQLVRNNQYGILDALPHAWRNTMTFTQLNFLLLGKMFTGKISLKSLGGPITIFQSAGTALNAGVVPFLSFLAFLSISIGVINILPIPGLDGGHLLFQLIEGINRKPLSERTQALCFRAGLIFILFIMLQSLINDIMRL